MQISANLLFILKNFIQQTLWPNGNALDTRKLSTRLILTQQIGDAQKFDTHPFWLQIPLYVDITLVTYLTAPHDCPHMRADWGPVGASGGQWEAQSRLLPCCLPDGLPALLPTSLQVGLLQVYLCATDD